MNDRQKPIPANPKDKNQGEGDYAADRRYRERTDQFLKSADVDELAHEAAPRSKAEADDMAEAEREGKSRAHLPKRRETVNKKRIDR